MNLSIALIVPATATESAIIAAVREHFAANGGSLLHGHLVNTQQLKDAEAGRPVNLGSKPSEHVAPVATVPAPPPAPVAASPQVEVDAEGFPWDARIHASTKTKTKDGKWRRRVGVEVETVEAVQSELAGVMNATGPAAPVGEDIVPADTLAAINAGTFDGTLTPEQVAWLDEKGISLTPSAAPAAPVAPAAPSAPPLPAAAPSLPPLPAAPAPSPYVQLVQLLTDNIQTGTLTDEWAAQVAAHFGAKDANGVGSLSLVQHNPDIAAKMLAYVTEALAGR